MLKKSDTLSRVEVWCIGSSVHFINSFREDISHDEERIATGLHQQLGFFLQLFLVCLPDVLVTLVHRHTIWQRQFHSDYVVYVAQHWCCCNYHYYYYHLPSVTSIQIYFEGAKFLPLEGGDEASAQRAETRGPKDLNQKPKWPKPETQRAESVVGFLRWGQQAPSHQLGRLESAVNSPSGRKFEFCATWDLKIHNRNAL